MKFISIYVRLAGLEVGDKNLFSTYRMKNILPAYPISFVLRIAMSDWLRLT
jgi:hypothetical protein